MSMQKTTILRFNYDFARVYRRGKYLSGRLVVVHYMKKRSTANRLGVSCSRKVKGAVHRNRRKRLLREAYRFLEPQIETGYDLILIARDWDEDTKCDSVTDDLEKLLRRIGVIKTDSGTGQKDSDRKQLEVNPDGKQGIVGDHPVL